MKKQIILTSLLYCIIFIYSLPLQAQHNLSKWVGPIPKKVSWIIDQFNPYDGFPSGFRNRLIIHGPPGNGKTSLAEAIAEATGSKLFRLNGPGIVTRYQGSGSETINSIFEDAINEINICNRNVVVFIDEIDAIASNTENEYRSEFKNTLQQLWIQLDAHKNNNKLLVICTTNNLTHLHRTFLDRFGNNIVTIENPDFDKRKKLLRYYLNNAQFSFDNTMLEYLAKKTAGLSARSIEDIVSDYQMELLANVVKNISYKKMNAIINQARKKFKKNKADDQKWKEKLERVSLYLGISSAFLASIVHLDYINKIIMAQYSTTTYHTIPSLSLYNTSGIAT